MDLYTILNLEPTASIEEIRRSYIRLAKKYHPDKCSDIDAKDKFERINYAYNILINDKSRNEYNIMNNINKSKFHTFLENIFKNNLKLNELKHFGITISEKEFTHIGSKLMNVLDKFDMSEIFKLFTNNIIPIKKYKQSEQHLCSESDIELWDETIAEYYPMHKLPIEYQKYNKNDIQLSLNISLDDLVNNRIRKIKINRQHLDAKQIITSYQFITKHPYIIFNEGGDIDDEQNGNLIIKLNLPNKFKWSEFNLTQSEVNCIYYEYNITLYQYMTGIINNIKLLDQEIEINNWLPYRDGSIMLLDKKINEYQMAIKFNLIYNNSTDSMNLLKKYFN